MHFLFLLPVVKYLYLWGSCQNGLIIRSHWVTNCYNPCIWQQSVPFHFCLWKIEVKSKGPWNFIKTTYQLSSLYFLASIYISSPWLWKYFWTSMERSKSNTKVMYMAISITCQLSTWSQGKPMTWFIDFHNCHQSNQLIMIRYLRDFQNTENTVECRNYYSFQETHKAQQRVLSYLINTMESIITGLVAAWEII